MSVPSKVLPSALALTTLTLPLFRSLLGWLVVVELAVAVEVALLLVLELEKGLMDSVGAVAVAAGAAGIAPAEVPCCCLAKEAAAPCKKKWSAKKRK